MLNSLIKKQRDSLDFFYKNVDICSIESTVELLLEVTGRIHVTGVGKSGYMAEKIAATLTSLGVSSHFLHPVNALHGDLGAVHADDIVLLLSKSGETNELIELTSHIPCKTVAITCAKESTLQSFCTTSMYLPLNEELCVYDMAPTTSATLQLLFGDLLAVELMKRKNVTLKEYHANHPSGIIGKKAKLTVEELMLKKEEIPTVEKSTSLRTIISLLSETRVGCVLVLKDEQIVGIFTDGDLKRVLLKNDNPLDLPVETFMTMACLQVDANMNVWEAAKAMQKGRVVHQAPVTKEGLLLGLLRMQDIIKEGIR